MHIGVRAILLAAVLAATVRKGQGNCSVEVRAKKIVDVSTRIESMINSFKDDFVMEILHMDWASASAALLPGTVEDECLPPPSPPPGSYTPRDFGEEVVRMYAIMQGYTTALNHLTLDRVFGVNTSYTSNITNIIAEINALLNHISKGITCQNLEPDNTQTERLLTKIYTDVGADRYKRDFAILRDTLDALKHCSEVFGNFI